MKSRSCRAAASVLRDRCHAPALTAACCLWVLVPAVLLGDGYRNPPEGAAAIGAFGGHRAFADDANTTIHNPANLVALDDAEVQLNVLGGYGQNRFHSLFGIADETEDRAFLIPGFAAALPFRGGRYAFGIAAYVPYGRSVDWGDDGFFARNNLPYAGSMTVADLTPNFAMRLADTFAFSLGADLYFGRVEQQILFSGPVARSLGLPDGARSKLTADGEAIGFNAALTWNLTGSQRLAATLRTPFEIDYTGDNTLDYVGRQDIKGTIDYPTIAAMAYGIELTDTFAIEADVEWLEFSTYQNLVIRSSNGMTTTTEMNLEDTWTFGFGARWTFTPKWILRAGVMRLQNPTPDATYSPLGPDEDQEVLSVGLGYEGERHGVSLSYAYGLFDGRDIQDSVNSPSGTYDYDLHLLSLSYRFKL